MNIHKHVLLFLEEIEIVLLVLHTNKVREGRVFFEFVLGVGIEILYRGFCPTEAGLQVREICLFASQH